MLVNAELTATIVDARSEGADAQRLALAHQLRDFRDIIQASAHHGSHILGGEVGLEPSRLVGDPRIARGVALVESIGGELLPVGPYLLQDLGVVAIGLTLLDELRLHVVQLVLELLTHGLSKRVAFATREVGQLTRQQHDLLLIDRDAVSVLQVLLHARDVVLDGLATLFAVDEIGNVIHRSRPVEGIHGDEILEGRGLQLAQVFLHARRLKLEGADRAAVAVELVGGRVFDIDIVDVDVNAQAVLDVGLCLLDDAERLQPEEVHLDESGVLDDGAFVLGATQLLPRLLVIGRRDGYPVAHIVATDDDTTGMDARIAYIAFEHLRKTDGVSQQGIR